MLSLVLGDTLEASFLADFWPRQVFHAAVATAAWPEFLIPEAWRDWRRINQYARGPLEVTQGGGGQYSVTGLSPEAAVRDLGLVVRLSRLEETFPGVGDWLRQLEGALKVPPGCARLSAFLNPAGLGLAPHCDPGEHFLFQVLGTKRVRWQENPNGAFVSASHATNVPLPPSSAAQFATEVPAWERLPSQASEVILRPGSVLMLPRGTYHETQAGAEDYCVTCVVNVAAPSRAEVLASYLRELLCQAEAWRMPALDDDSLRVAWGALMQELAARVPALRPSEVLAPRWGGSNALAPTARFVRDPAVAVALRDADAKVELTLSGANVPCRSVHLSREVTPVLEHVLSTAQVQTPNDLARKFTDWEPRSLTMLLGFLERHGALVPVRVPAYSGVSAPTSGL